MAKSKRNKGLGKVSRETRRLLEIANERLRDEVLKHKRLGVSVVGMKNGEVVSLAPHEIPLDDKGNWTESEE